MMSKTNLYVLIVTNYLVLTQLVINECDCTKKILYGLALASIMNMARGPQMGQMMPSRVAMPIPYPMAMPPQQHYQPSYSPPPPPKAEPQPQPQHHHNVNCNYHCNDQHIQHIEYNDLGHYGGCSHCKNCNNHDVSHNYEQAYK